ncbi:MAG: hypothetical protein Q8P61_04500 [Candidatus Nanopelagicales bacterium]|nr:hypothetical protein [Candidatus Nanopelagicales bacterium]
MPESRSLWITRHLSSTQAARLRETGWSFVSDTDISLDMAGYSASSPAHGPDVGVDRSGLKWPPAFSRVVHAILSMSAGERLVQTELAHVAGVSQPYVSGVLKNLVSSSLLTDRLRSPETDTWLNLTRIWAQARAWRPITTYWTGTVDLVQGLRLARVALRQPWAVSGDIAADAIAPWRRPEQLVILARGGTLASTPLVQVTSGEPAQVILHATTDKIALPEDAPALPWRSEQLAVAQPLQVWWDLLQSPGVDAPEAAEHLIGALAKQRATR